MDGEEEARGDRRRDGRVDGAEAERGEEVHAETRRGREQRVLQRDVGEAQPHEGQCAGERGLLLAAADEVEGLLAGRHCEIRLGLVRA